MLLSYKQKIIKELKMENKKEDKKIITKDMIIDDVLKLDENLGEVFMGFGMHCIFCY